MDVVCIKHVYIKLFYNSPLWKWSLLNLLSKNLFIIDCMDVVCIILFIQVSLHDLCPEGHNRSHMVNFKKNAFVQSIF